MKYTVKVQYPLYLDVEVEADDIPDAREMAMEIAGKTPLAEWEESGFPEIYETEWTDDSGLNTII